MDRRQEEEIAGGLGLGGQVSGGREENGRLLGLSPVSPASAGSLRRG